MDISSLISVIVLILFFGSIFITAIGYEVWKVRKKKSSSSKENSLDKSKQQLSTDDIESISKNRKEKR